jgi:hypothetical protein
LLFVSSSSPTGGSPVRVAARRPGSQLELAGIYGVRDLRIACRELNRQPGADVGTFNDVVAKLPYLQSLGINAIELLPVAEFEGDVSCRGWLPADR